MQNARWSDAAELARFGIGKYASGKAQQFGYGLSAQGAGEEEALAEAAAELT